MLYQLKILTTALISSVVFGKALSTQKWFSLALLTAGVAIVQGGADEASSAKRRDVNDGNRTLGTLAVLAATLTSGVAGCYFEWLLRAAPAKASQPVSIWQRNLELALPCFLFTVLACVAQPVDRQLIQQYGFLQGYTALTWTVIIDAAVGGLLVAIVVRDVGVITKGFATSIAIVGK